MPYNQCSPLAPCFEAEHIVVELLLELAHGKGAVPRGVPVPCDIGQHVCGEPTCLVAKNALPGNEKIGLLACTNDRYLAKHRREGREL